MKRTVDDLLLVCRKCGSVITPKTRKKHKRWHKVNKPIPGPPGPQGAMGLSGGSTYYGGAVSDG